jgi:hypothetical protein
MVRRALEADDISLKMTQAWKSDEELKLLVFIEGFGDSLQDPVDPIAIESQFLKIQ